MKSKSEGEAWAGLITRNSQGRYSLTQTRSEKVKPNCCCQTLSSKQINFVNIRHIQAVHLNSGSNGCTPYRKPSFEDSSWCTAFAHYLGAGENMFWIASMLHKRCVKKELGEWRKTNADMSTTEQQNVLIGFVRRQKQVLSSWFNKDLKSDLWYDLHWQQIIRQHKGLQKEYSVLIFIVWAENR